MADAVRSEGERTSARPRAVVVAPRPPTTLSSLTLLLLLLYITSMATETATRDRAAATTELGHAGTANPEDVGHAQQTIAIRGSTDMTAIQRAYNGAAFRIINGVVVWLMVSK